VIVVEPVIEDLVICVKALALDLPPLAAPALLRIRRGNADDDHEKSGGHSSGSR